MKKIHYIIISFFFLLSVRINAQFLINPSFEGQGLDNNAPADWYPCTPLCSPDNPPLYEIQIFLEASQGSRYLSLRTRGGESWNTTNPYVNDDVSTPLLKPLVKGSNYKLKIDLANDTYVTLWGINVFTKPSRLRVWGCTTECSQDELLGETGAVSDTIWKTYEFCFTPKNNSYNYFLLEADYVNNDSVSGMLLVDNLIITENPDTLSAVIALDTVVIPGNTVELHASESESYKWTPSDGLSCSDCRYPQVLIDGAKTFNVRLVGKYDCISNEKFIIRMPDCVEISNAKSGLLFDTTIFYGESVQMDAGEGENYNWTPTEFLSCTNCQSAVSVPTRAMNYTCTFTDENNCTISNEFRIRFNIKVPNVITPNGDGYNDYFFIGGLPPDSYLKITDRAGRQIYETKSYNNLWPSENSGLTDKQTDTYWYTLECPGMEVQQGYVLVKF